MGPPSLKKETKLLRKEVGGVQPRLVIGHRQGKRPRSALLLEGWLWLTVWPLEAINSGLQLLVSPILFLSLLSSSYSGALLTCLSWAWVTGWVVSLVSGLWSLVARVLSCAVWVLWRCGS